MKRILSGSLLISFYLFSQSAAANPYWDMRKVPRDSSYSRQPYLLKSEQQLKTVHEAAAIDVLRVQVDWQANETYQLTQKVVEASGTPALLARTVHKQQLGSYLGILKDVDGKSVYYDAVGTGKEYRKLTRALSFRFPVPTQVMTFEMYAENPQSGVMEKVITETISPSALQTQNADKVEVKELSLSKEAQALRVNIYAEGYSAAEKQEFWDVAQKAVQALQREKFPGIEKLSFYAVFKASNRKLGSAGDLGLPVPEFDSFLGLYYPYWNKFGRWYNVVYPTREDKMRHGFASAAYDYAIVLVKNSGYWGVGNYMAYTAIPAENSAYFTYLLTHEFGHFFGLNEEYEGGGPTELEFAPDTQEPWSQNITFLRDTKYDNLKWKKLVDPKRKLPTPVSDWKSSPPVYGAYRGGYADSEVTRGQSYKPGLNCTMESAKHFCDICTAAIKQVIKDGVGVDVKTR